MGQALQLKWSGTLTLINVRYQHSPSRRHTTEGMCCCYYSQIPAPRVGAPLPWLPASSHTETALVTLRIHSADAQMTCQLEWHKNFPLHCWPEGSPPEGNAMFSRQLYLHKVLGFGSAWSWEVPVEATRHCRAGEQTEASISSSINRYFTTNFHGSYVIDWLLTRKVVKCLRAVKWGQGEVWDAGAGGRNWELALQWMVN